MTFLPIVERELREGARKKSPRYTRLVVAAVALLIGLFQITFVPFFSRGTVQGGVAFSIITGFAFLLCVGAGVFFTADCLSEEKREGTLGLLFLTDLRGYDVVLGKLAAQLVHLGYALLAIIPGAALPLLLGGVTGGELWRISLALANLLLFALASGVLASSVCREAGRSMALTAAILLFFCLFLPLMQGAGTAAWGPRADWIGWPSPSLAYVKAMETSYLRSPKVYWWALAGSHMLAWLMIGIASIVIPRTWQDRPKREVFNPNTIAPTTPRTVQTDAPVTITRRNPELLEADPLLWLIGQRQGVKAGVWAICVLWLVVVFIAVLLAGPDALLGLVWIGWAGLLGLKVLFTFEACRFFASTRRAGAFEFLLSTPHQCQPPDLRTMGHAPPHVRPAADRRRDRHGCGGGHVDRNSQFATGRPSGSVDGQHGRGGGRGPAAGARHVCPGVAGHVARADHEETPARGRRHAAVRNRVAVGDDLLCMVLRVHSRHHPDRGFRDQTEQ
jgi:ABC-type transport system involved in multi-copper enzyme maturation permease subunit